MNLVKIKMALIVFGISIFVCIFGYILIHTGDTRTFTKYPNILGIGLIGFGLSLIIGVALSYLYMAIICMADNEEQKIDKKGGMSN